MTNVNSLYQGLVFFITNTLSTDPMQHYSFLIFKAEINTHKHIHVVSAEVRQFDLFETPKVTNGLPMDHCMTTVT